MNDFTELDFTELTIIAIAVSIVGVAVLCVLSLVMYDTITFCQDPPIDIGEDRIIDMDWKPGGIGTRSQCVIKTESGRLLMRVSDCGGLLINQTIKLYKCCETCDVKFR